MKKILLLCIVLLLSACSNKEASNDIRIGTIAGPETQLMEEAKKIALKRYGLHVDIVVFSDYSMPNQALAEGAIDANAFQHLPFLEAQNKMHGYHLVSVGKTFLYPMGLYSHFIKKLSELPDNAKIAIPNDPSNEARALLLLQNAKLIQLKSNATINVTPEDVISNPKHFQLIALDAAELPRALSDVNLAAINTNYAMPVGLSPSKNALFAETVNSPYVNIIAARTNNARDKKVQELVAAFQTAAVVQMAQTLFGKDGAIPGFIY